VHYFCDMPDGSWAEFLCREEIIDLVDLPTILCVGWVVNLGEEPVRFVALPLETLTGGLEPYAAYQEEARCLRRTGEMRFIAPSAALLSGGAREWWVTDGLPTVSPRDGLVIALFRRRTNVTGQPAARDGRPGEEMLAQSYTSSARVGRANLYTLEHI